MTDINVGAITEALNNKVDLPTPSTPQDAVDYVVEKQDPTSANGYTWYRKYADGWVEQGVIKVEIGTAIYTFNFPILMANTNYTVMTSVLDILNTVAMTAKYYSKATTGVNVRSTYQDSSIRGDIMVCGMSA